MKLLATIILALSLQGCMPWFNKRPDPPVIVPQQVTIDQYLLEPCPKLDYEVDASSFESMLVVHADLLTMYVNCANKQAAGVLLLKKFGNIK